MLSLNQKIVYNKYLTILKHYNHLRSEVSDTDEFDFEECSQWYEILQFHFSVKELVDLLNIKDVYNNIEMMKVIDAIIVHDCMSYVETLTQTEIEQFRNDCFGLMSSVAITVKIDRYLNDMEQKEKKA